MSSHVRFDDQSHGLAQKFDDAMTEAERELLGLYVEMESPDEAIYVVLNADGSTQLLEIDEDRYEEYDEDSLADTIIMTLSVAKRKLSHARRNVVNEKLGWAE